MSNFHVPSKLLCAAAAAGKNNAISNPAGMSFLIVFPLSIDLKRHGRGRTAVHSTPATPRSAIMCVRARAGNIAARGRVLKHLPNCPDSGTEFGGDGGM